MNANSTPHSVDSVPIDAPHHSKLTATNLKLLLIMFMLFIFVSSDVFIENVVSGFGDGAVKNRNVTSWGVVLQGIFFVIIYAVFVYLFDTGIL